MLSFFVLVKALSQFYHNFRPFFYQFRLVLVFIYCLAQLYSVSLGNNLKIRLSQLLPKVLTYTNLIRLISHYFIY